MVLRYAAAVEDGAVAPAPRIGGTPGVTRGPTRFAAPAARCLLERLVEATYTRDRRRHLTAANLGIGGWRKAHEAAQG